MESTLHMLRHDTTVFSGTKSDGICYKAAQNSMTVYRIRDHHKRYSSP